MSVPPIEIEYVSPSVLKDHARNARTHSKKQIAQIAKSIAQFGFNCPVAVRTDYTILAGHGRVAAARDLGLDPIPIIKVEHLSDAECRAFMLADNKIAANAGWDFEILAAELADLTNLEFDVSVTGFSVAEIDFAISEAEESSPKDLRASLEDEIPEHPLEPVSRRGDLWLLGRHRLLCGDARKVDDYNQLLGGELVDLVFTDPPYNVPIAGNVCGLGKVVHGDFAMACGEMSEEEFTDFLTVTLTLAAQSCRDGAIAYVCIDWRHMGELITAGKKAFSELKNVCVWKKSSGGMGTFYRSQHEMVFVFKKGTAPHTNNFGLGDTGRYRTNVWQYAGISSMTATRSAELEMHPTVKPVALVMDAIKDCSKRGELVLDAFGGSGTTLVAAEKCGRVARLIEFEPKYCDTIINRYQNITGKKATLASNGETFEDVAAARSTQLQGDVA